ncbi:hypothetical protein C5U48_10765 [Mycolicibacter virginiensis]|uniref:Uncharacterized protein n=2 Tax=Mycolicibacter virginiensis TaxID=1795032 RepID=A0A9X7INK4_9MYCO|nr:hypothetical protein C5U48_10765 [Mycolicibacter virginiensis]
MVVPALRGWPGSLAGWGVPVVLRACSAMAALVVWVLTAPMVALGVRGVGCSVMAAPVAPAGRHWMCWLLAVMVVPAVM